MRVTDVLCLLGIFKGVMAAVKISVSVSKDWPKVISFAESSFEGKCLV